MSARQMTPLEREFGVDVQNQYEPYVDKSEDPSDELEVIGGTFGDGPIDSEAPGAPQLLSHPDQAQLAAILINVAQAIQAEITRERKMWDDLNNSGIRVNSNLSQEVLFQRYATQAAPIQICREKVNRGRIMIGNFTDGQSLYVGLHAGIIAGGTDTIRIPGSSTTGNRLTVSTRRALWCIGSQLNMELDVVEEFG